MARAIEPEEDRAHWLARNFATIGLIPAYITFVWRGGELLDLWGSKPPSWFETGSAVIAVGWLLAMVAAPHLSRRQ